MAVNLCGDVRFRVTFLNGIKPNFVKEFKVCLTSCRCGYGGDFLVPPAVAEEVARLRGTHTRSIAVEALVDGYGWCLLTQT